jgi:hypothetical protein
MFGYQNLYFADDYALYPPFIIHDMVWSASYHRGLLTFQFLSVLAINVAYWKPEIPIF